MKETQWLLSNPVIWVVLLISLGSILLAAALDDAASEPAWVLWLVGALMVPFMTSNLRFRLDPDRLVITYWPFWRRTIALDQIASVTTREVRPLRDMGGWGIRPIKGGIAYTVWGRTVVCIELTSGRQVWVGTRRARDWELAFQSAGLT